jgi:hypothetical protein
MVNASGEIVDLPVMGSVPKMISSISDCVGAKASGKWENSILVTSPNRFCGMTKSPGAWIAVPRPQPTDVADYAEIESWAMDLRIVIYVCR